jgi:hypothetical protein
MLMLGFKFKIEYLDDNININWYNSGLTAYFLLNNSTLSTSCTKC